MCVNVCDYYTNNVISIMQANFLSSKLTHVNFVVVVVTELTSVELTKVNLILIE